VTDLEITKLCAEAMGYRNSSHYNPLHDDAQAMALVKRQGLHIVWQPMCPDIWKVDDTTHVAADKDLNRAICECVAKMQASNAKTP